MARELILVVLVVMGCGAPEKPVQRGRGGPMEPPETERPAMRVCAVDSDCTVVSEIGPNPDDPCCDMTMPGAAFSRAYVNWHFWHRKRHCTGVKCPPMKSHGPPKLACAREAQCKQGVCGNACQDWELRSESSGLPGTGGGR